MASPTTPREIIQTLRRLQVLDDEIRQVRRDRDTMVDNLERLRRVLEHFDREVSDKRDKLSEAETWHQRKSTELQEEREKLTKSKQRLSGVSKSREYVAVNREMDVIRKAIAAREDEVAKLTAAIDEFRATIRVEEAKIGDLRAEADRTAAENLARLETMNQQIQAVEDSRLGVAGCLDRAVLQRYARIAEARDGLAVVAVVADPGGGPEYTCAGCNMVLQPRFIEFLLRGSSLVQCPHCNRFLFVEVEHDPDGMAVVCPS
jgi:predicted  nucleic acid-binding Zn-ribbon protein